MVIALAKTDENKQIVMMGLTEQNLTLLKAGKSIIVNSKTHTTPQGIEYFIFYGKDEHAIKALLDKANAIGPETKVFEDPRLTEPRIESGEYAIIDLYGDGTILRLCRNRPDLRQLLAEFDKQHSDAEDNRVSFEEFMHDRGVDLFTTENYTMRP